jgi:glycosyltransferase involved in cell wall biosynthesis
MKIVLGTHHYPPRYVAGVELITARLARQLTNRGHTVDVVCVEEIDAAVPLSVTTDLHDGIRVHRLGLQLTGQPVGLGVRFRDDRLGEWFADFFRRHQPDIFHSQSSYLLSASPLEAARYAGIKTVVTLHDYWYLCPRLTLLRSDGQVCATSASPADCAWCLMGERRRFRTVAALRRRCNGQEQNGSDGVPWRWLVDRGLLTLMEERQRYVLDMLRAVDALVSPAPLARDLLIRRGLPAERIKLVRFGLEVGLPASARRRRQAGELRVGYLGQVTPHKGVQVLIEAYRALAVAAPQVALAIHGDLTRFPEYTARLRGSAAGLPAVRFMGAYDNRSIGDVLRDLDVVVVPSLWFEVSPLVILEAFSAGVPVIASRHPNLAWLVRDEEDGLLFTPGDAADLARQLRRLIDEPGLLARLAAGIRPVRTVDDEVDELEALYRSLLVERGDDREAMPDGMDATPRGAVVAGG